mgnify:CR=1 FL=1
MAEGFDLKALASVLEGMQRQLKDSMEDSKALREELLRSRQETQNLKQRMDNFVASSTSLLQESVAGGSSAASSTPAVATQVIHAISPIIPLAAPERFSGDPHKTQVFLTQCSLHFLCRPVVFSENHSKVAFILSYLSGDAAAWSMPLVTRNDPILYDYEGFKTEFLRIFDRRAAAQATDNELLDLKQGNRDLITYLAQFNKLIVETGWPEEKRAAIFYRGLKDELKDALSQIPKRPTEVSELIDLVLQMDHRLSERRNERRRDHRPLPPRFDRVSLESSRVTETPAVEEPMQIGSIRGPLSKEEKEKRRQGKLCLYCGNAGHFVKECPKKPKGSFQLKDKLHQ